MASSRRARILIVDDSAAMRSLVRAAVSLDRSCEVAGVAENGESALQMIESLRPDLVVLDVEMPVMDGLVTLRTLRDRGHRMPVIMCSSLTQRGARVTVDALSAGATDYVAKPSSQSGVSAALQALASDLNPRIQALTASLPGRAASSPESRPETPPGAHRAHAPAAALPSVVVMGVSTGGPVALDEILPAIPAEFPLPILIVQHMPDLFTRHLAERLSMRCALPVREAEEGARVVPGVIQIARGNWHLEVVASRIPLIPPTLHLSQSALENHCRPSVDVLFRSAAAAFGGGVLAAVLTGMGRDGLEGCRAIRSRGGWVIAQDRPTSVVWGMPGAVVNAGLANRVLSLSAIVPEMLRLTRNAHVEVRELRETAVHP